MIKIKYTIVFTIAILLTLIFPSNIKAYSNSDFINVDYNNNIISETMNINENFINFMDNYLIPQLNASGYDYLISINMLGTDNNTGFDEYQYCVTQKQNSTDIFQIRSSFRNGYLSGLEGKPNDLLKRYYCYSSNSYNNNEYTTDNVYSFLSSQSFATNPGMVDYTKIQVPINSVNGNIYDNITASLNTTYSIIYRSNTDILTTKSNTSGTYVPITFNGENKAYYGDKFYTYVDVMGQYNNGIQFEVSPSCDLNNIDIASIKIKYGSYNSNYRYQYRINELEWIDVTNDIQNASLQGYYEVITSIYCNCNIEARIIDNDNNVIKTNTQVIDILNHNFEIDFNNTESCDLSNRDINTLTADFFYCWKDTYVYQYSYDNSTWYNIPLTSSNKRFTLNHGIYTPVNFRILNNNSVIYTTTFNDFVNIVKHINIDLNYNDTNTTIIINVDFSQYTQFRDMYNMRVLINGQEINNDSAQYVIDKNNYDNFQEFQMDVYIDDYLVDSQCYSPTYGGLTFEEKYNNIQMDKLEEELNTSDNNTLGGLISTANNFINAIGSIITTIFNLIMRFFNGLNVWIRSAVISEFIIMVVCKIIKVVRK